MKSGQVTLWQSDGAVEINALGRGEFLTRMKQDPASSGVIATGGKEADLHLWDLQKPEEAIFTAKNVGIIDASHHLPCNSQLSQICYKHSILFEKQNFLPWCNEIFHRLCLVIIYVKHFKFYLIFRSSLTC